MTDTRLGRPPVAIGWVTSVRHVPVVLLGGLYLYVIGLKAARRPLWFDEILTYYVANLGSPRVIVEALLAKAENHPPLDYVARHFSMSLFGGSELAFRLPSVVAMLAAAACLYLIVLRRTSVLPALVAFSFPFITFALDYAHEGRPYAFLLASMCLSFLAWQLATDKPSLVRFAFLALCLGLGPHSHYYGVLNFLPIAVGEAVRSWERRQISWAIVACFAVALATVALLIPFVLHSTDFAAHFWTKFGPGLAVFIYVDLLGPALPGVVAALAACAVAVFFFPRETAIAVDRLTVPRHEVAAALTICALPFTTFVLATLVTHAYADKYLINTVAGVGLVIAYLTWQIQGARRGCALLITLCCCLWMAGTLGYMARYMPSRPYSVPAAELQVIEATTLPVALFNAHLFLATRFYLPPHLRDKVYFLTDPKLAVAYSGTNTNEIVFRNLEPFVPMHAANLCEFTKRHSQFLILLKGSTWVVPQLLKDNAKVTLLAGDPTKSAFLSVTLDGPSGC